MEDQFLSISTLNSRHMKVAVTGGAGLVGRFVVSELLHHGHVVRALVRSPSDADSFGGLQHRIDWVIGDMNDTQVLSSLVSDMDALVHTAFSHLAGRFRGGEGNNPLGFWKTNFGSAITAIEESRFAGVRRVVLLSSRAVFDGLNFQSEDIDDQEFPCPTSHYGLLKVASEQLSQLYADMDICSIRPTGIYGVTHPVSKTKWWNMLCNHIDGPGDLPIDGSPRTEVHGADVARAITLLLTSDASDVRCRSFNCTDITVSEQSVMALARKILTEGSNPSTNELLMLDRPRNKMAAAALHSLGWQPGGYPRLTQTLSEIVELARFNG